MKIHATMGRLAPPVIYALLAPVLACQTARTTGQQGRKTNPAATQEFLSMDLTDVEAVRRVVARGADVNATREGDSMPRFCSMVFEVRAELVELLLKNGADPNIRCFASGLAQGFKPLHVSGMDRDPKYLEKSADVAKLLLAHGADVNARSDAGITPLDVAASNGIQSLVTTLQAAGGKPNCDPNRNPKLAHDLCK